MAQSHLRALELLEFLVSHPEVGTVPALAEASGVGRATAYRMVDELVRAGWLLESQSPKRFAPSLRVLQLGLGVFRDNSVRETLFRSGVQLASVVNSSVLISFYEDGDVVYTDLIQVLGEAITSTILGYRLNATCSAPGKAFLADLDDASLAVIVARGAPKLTSQTKTGAHEILKDIDATRAAGYGFADGEFQHGVAGVAMLVFNRDARAIGALSVGRSPDEPRDGYPENVLESLRYYTAKASSELGYRARAGRALA